MGAGSAAIFLGPLRITKISLHRRRREQQLEVALEGGNLFEDLLLREAGEHIADDDVKIVPAVRETYLCAICIVSSRNRERRS
jgi:hypothetical protein